MELNTLYIKKLTMNKAEILFDDIKKAIEWSNFLQEQHVSHAKVVYHKDNKVYFGFKMFRCRYQMPKLMLKLNKEE